MPSIQPISAIVYNRTDGDDISDCIAPPYDVLDAQSKGALLERNAHNIVAVDLPHLPAKTLGPDETYQQAGETFRQWLGEKVLDRIDEPAVFVYSQIVEINGETFDRRGIIANVKVQDFGPGEDSFGGVFPHEKTFSAAKQDRLKLMQATRTQLSPIFGLYNDDSKSVEELITQIVESSEPTFHGTTANDNVRHRVWMVSDPEQIKAFEQALGDKDVFIADGHHRYTTAINYRNEVGAGGPADWCMFVLVAMQDPGMLVLPTHRVLGGMADFSIDRLRDAAAGKLQVDRFELGDMATLEKALPNYGPHAMGLVDGDEDNLYIATTVDDDPLAGSYPDASVAWRQLDVAVLQHLMVEQILQPTFCKEGDEVAWKFPHTLVDLKLLLDSGDYQLGTIMQPTPLDSVMAVSEAGELMPQKSTFFYPKLATGLVLNPLE